MIDGERARPSDSRGFIHKRIIGGISGAFSGGLGGALGGFFRPGGGGGGVTLPFRTPAQTARDRAMQDPRFLTPAATAVDVLGHIAHGHIPGTAEGHPFHARFTGGGAGGCQPPLVADIDGECRFPGSPADISVGGTMIGPKYGRGGYLPVDEPQVRRVCDRGDVLGDDGYCYDSLKNKERMWPKGRAPLLTGGERNAITRSKRAAGKVGRTVETLIDLGMLQKKAAPRRRKKKAVPQLPAHLAVDVS